ncbi:MAG TPA: hypothetical protein VG498_07390 [Terriglobales bacterium]|nr:hypothetical protein [Terriglobales bacterium]
MKKLYFLALTVMLLAPALSRELSDGGPIPICGPGDPNCAIQGDNVLLPL